jgi:hypothetical protein
MDLRDTTSGVVGAVFNVYAGLPFDVLKVRLQTQKNPPIYHGLTDCLVKTVRHESIRSLWKGAIPALSSSILENAVLFSANGVLRRVCVEKSSASSLSTLDEALLGSAAGLFSAAAITPAEVIKCRLQTYQNAGSMGVLRCVQTVVRENGILGLTAGLPAVMLRDIPFHFCFFGTYEHYTSWFMEKTNAMSRRELHPLAVLACGGFAGATSWSVVFPADVIKSRMQVDARLSLRHAILSVWRLHGLKGFYRGWSSAVLGSFPADGCLFLGVEMTHRVFAHLDLA